MNSENLIYFVMGLIGLTGWTAISLKLKLNEFQSNIAKGASLFLLVLPSFIGLENSPAVQKLLWPLIAGIFIGEVVLQKIRKRIAEQDKVKQETGFEEPTFIPKNKRGKKKETPEERKIRIQNETPEEKEIRRKRREERKKREAEENKKREG